MRQFFEEIEEKTLAPYAAKSKSSLGRRYPEDPHPYRTCFQRDRDRIIHSSAFRRLQYKTQVFVNHEGDHYRTRLTHTLETCQIAKTIAQALQLNQDLVETLAFVHDIGHPPFGHAGEEELKRCMSNHGGFEHNLQALRIVEILEQRYPDFAGLNLTYEVLESIRKHSPAGTVEERFHLEWRPLLECQVVNEADNIAYNAHDIEDGVRAGLIALKRLENVELWQEAIQEAMEKYPTIYKDEETLLKQSVKMLINKLVSDLIFTTKQMIDKYKIDSIDAVRNAPVQIVTFSQDIVKKKQGLERFLTLNLYNHYKVARMCERAKRFVRDLFEEYVKHPEELSPKYQKWSEIFGVHRAVSDYIAGMTDRYAQEEYKKLFYPFEKV